MRCVFLKKKKSDAQRVLTSGKYETSPSQMNPSTEDKIKLTLES